MTSFDSARTWRASLAALAASALTGAICAQNACVINFDDDPAADSQVRVQINDGTNTFLFPSGGPLNVGPSTLYKLDDHVCDAIRGHIQLQSSDFSVEKIGDTTLVVRPTSGNVGSASILQTPAGMTIAVLPTTLDGWQAVLELDEQGANADDQTWDCTCKVVLECAPFEFATVMVNAPSDDYDWCVAAWNQLIACGNTIQAVGNTAIVQETPMYFVSNDCAGLGASTWNGFTGIVVGGGGGGFPGSLSLALRDGPPMALGAVLLSATAGPTPLRLIDPRDDRSLSIGLQGLMVFAGRLDAAGNLTALSAPLPNLPSLKGAPMFAQGVSLPGTNTLIGQISNPVRVTFGDTGAFQDRGTRMRNGRASARTVRLDERRVLITGGGGGPALAPRGTRTTEVYDPMADAYTAGPAMTAERAMHTVTPIGSRRLLVGGYDAMGQPQASAEVFDVASQRFTAAASMSTARAAHATIALPDGRVIVLGGFGGDPTTPTGLASALATTEIYDPSTGTWATGPRMLRPRAGHRIALLPDATYWILGGISASPSPRGNVPGLTGSTEIYDPSTDTFTAGPQMTAARAFFTLTNVGDERWLAAGGFGALGSQGPVPTDTTELGRTHAMTWTPAARMAQPRALHGAYVLGGRIRVAGGLGGGSSSEVYDAGRDAFIAGPSMTVPRYGFLALPDPTGQVQILGGMSGLPPIASSTTEWHYR